MASTATAKRGRATAAAPAIVSAPVRMRLVDPAQPRRIRVSLRGMSPLMLDPMSQEVMESMVTGKKIQIAKDRPLEQVCREKLDILRDETGRLMLPRNYLWGTLHTAGEHVKYKGKMNIATASQPGKAAKSRLAAFFLIEEKHIPIFDEDGKEPAWEVDLSVGNGATSKNAIVRPRFEQWNLDFTFQYDDGDVNEGTIRALLSIAGKMIGLGCKRACLKHGECGQFVVSDWQDITPSDWPRTKASKPKKSTPVEEEPESEGATDEN